MRIVRAGRTRGTWLAWGLVCVVLGAGASPSDRDSTPWSVTPVRRPEVPRLAIEPWVRNPIDAFVLRALRSHRLAPAPEADRRTLIRRLSFDLVGLPPTPEEVEAFERDRGPDAYGRLVDRLLDSPHYGERWARHWLDLARFAETHGYERDDPKPNAWRYRDWVVRALNRDLPYDRFLTEQLAGDELPDASADSRIATAFLRLGLVDDEPADPLMDRFDQLDDVVRAVGTTMLGLTIHCARCHDHKFDPISQRDYYRILAFFTPGKRFVRNDNSSIELDLATPLDRERFRAANAAIDAEAQVVKDALESLRAPHRQALFDERTRDLDNETVAALQTPADRRDSEQKRLASDAGRAAKIKVEEIDARFSREEASKKEDLASRLAAIEARRPAPLPETLGFTDLGPSSEPTRLLVRGDAHHPGEEIVPGFLSMIDAGPAKVVPPPGGKTTGRRLALARWIVGPENPLTARVIVNRLWQHHFGQGLVASASDFGTMGDEPSHPELLDWLAADLVARGWSLKAMHRLMVTSATYRQSGRWDEAAASADAADAWLWRIAPRRLEAEPIRDAVLAVSGALNREFGGPSVTPRIEPAVLAGQSRPGNGWGRSDARSESRRSLYVYVKRTLPLPELEVLDAPDTGEPCPRRAVTTTAPQALTLLNGRFFHDQASLFADRLRREAGDDPAAQIDRAFRLALARGPSGDERRDSLDFLDAQAARIRKRPGPEQRTDPTRDALVAFCLVLLNSNEFVTID